MNGQSSPGRVKKILKRGPQQLKTSQSSSPGRSETVEKLITEEANDPLKVPYEEVFKSRPKVVDDRSPSRSRHQTEQSSPTGSPARPNHLAPSFQFHAMQQQHSNQTIHRNIFPNDSIEQQRREDDDLYIQMATAISAASNSYSNGYQGLPHQEYGRGTTGLSPEELLARSKRRSPEWHVKPAWQPAMVQQDLRALNVQQSNPSSKEEASLLNSSSEMFALPVAESRMLDEYKQDVSGIAAMNAKIEKLQKQMKEVKHYIRTVASIEEESVLPHVVRLQALFRGIAVRQRLRREGVGFVKTRRERLESRYSDKKRDYNAAAVKIQSVWRGSNTRARLGAEFRIHVLLGVQRKQSEAIAQTRREMGFMKQLIETQAERMNVLEELLRKVLGDEVNRILDCI